MAQAADTESSRDNDSDQGLSSTHINAVRLSVTQSDMAVTQILVLLVTATVSDLTLGQTYNGYINPLFLPRGLRRGRLYDPNFGDLRDPGYLPSRGDDYRRFLLGQDYNRYDDYRRYQSPYDSDRRYQRPYDIDRRYPSAYDSNRRYPSAYENDRSYLNPYGGYRQYSNSYDGYRRYPNSLNDGRFNDLALEDNRVQYPTGVGLGTTAAPLDRGQLLDRGVDLRERIPGLDREVSLDGRSLGLGQGLVLERGLGMNRGLVGLENEQDLDRRQILSTTSPELSVSVGPNSST